MYIKFETIRNDFENVLNQVKNPFKLIVEKTVFINSKSFNSAWIPFLAENIHDWDIKITNQSAWKQMYCV